MEIFYTSSHFAICRHFSQISTWLQSCLSSKYKCAPVSVTLKNEPQVSENLYEKSNSKKVKPKFKVGDFVRINKTKRTFDKGYLPNWTQELFQILAVVKTQTPITYKIKDLEGELVKGTFYSHELQRVETDQI